jgi:fatty acid desaturase
MTTNAAAPALLWLASWSDSGWAIIAVIVAFSYVLLTNYALLHEGTHCNLHTDPRATYWLGVLCGLLFPIPFSMIRITHQGHHHSFRSDARNRLLASRDYC